MDDAQVIKIPREVLDSGKNHNGSMDYKFNNITEIPGIHPVTVIRCEEKISYFYCGIFG